MNTIDLIQAAAKRFDLSIPFTADQLKTSYRQRARSTHPDREDGSHALFLKCQDDYEFLSDHTSMAANNIHTECPYHTDNGVSIETLGKGWPEAPGAIPCGPCEGKGRYREVNQPFVMESVSDYCDSCHGDGWIGPVISCPICKGKKGTTNSPTPNCNKCKNTGTINIGKRIHCSTCKGLGWIYRKTKINMPKMVFIRFCHQCEGRGERPLWNPVIPRTAILR